MVVVVLVLVLVLLLLLLVTVVVAAAAAAGVVAVAMLFVVGCLVFLVVCVHCLCRGFEFGRRWANIPVYALQQQQ